MKKLTGLLALVLFIAPLAFGMPPQGVDDYQPQGAGEPSVNSGAGAYTSTIMIQDRFGTTLGMIDTASNTFTRFEMGQAAESWLINKDGSRGATTYTAVIKNGKTVSSRGPLDAERNIHNGMGQKVATERLVDVDPDDPSKGKTWQTYQTMSYNSNGTMNKVTTYGYELDDQGNEIGNYKAISVQTMEYHGGGLSIKSATTVDPSKPAGENFLSKTLFSDSGQATTQLTWNNDSGWQKSASYHYSNGKMTIIGYGPDGKTPTTISTTDRHNRVKVTKDYKTGQVKEINIYKGALLDRVDVYGAKGLSGGRIAFHRIGEFGQRIEKVTIENPNYPPPPPDDEPGDGDPGDTDPSDTTVTDVGDYTRTRQVMDDGSIKITFTDQDGKVVKTVTKVENADGGWDIHVEGVRTNAAGDEVKYTADIVRDADNNLVSRTTVIERPDGTTVEVTMARDENSRADVYNVSVVVKDADGNVTRERDFIRTISKSADGKTTIINDTFKENGLTRRITRVRDNETGITNVTGRVMDSDGKLVRMWTKEVDAVGNVLKFTEIDIDRYIGPPVSDDPGPILLGPPVSDDPGPILLGPPDQEPMPISDDIPGPLQADWEL